MKLFKLFLFSLVAFISAVAAMESSFSQIKPKSTVIAMDMDDVLSIKQKPGVMDFIGLSRIVFRHPWILAVLMNMGELHKEGIEIGQKLNGAGNTVHAVVEKLKERGYGDFSGYEDEILERAIKPKPIQAMVDAMKNLKKQGYILIGATSHDWKQDLAYRKKMREQGADLNDLFDAVVVARVNHIPTVKGEKASFFYKPVTNENMYSATLQKAYKPRKPYYTTLKKVAKHIADQKGVLVDKIIFTDDKQENIDAAKEVGLETIHFDLPSGSARKTSPEDLQKTVDSWKKQLNQHGVAIK